MLLTTKGRYAVMALVDMVYYGMQNQPSALHEISQRQGIDLNYMEQIFAKLKKNNLVKSIRGPGGGYLLTKDPREICIADIIFSVEEPIKITRCNNEISNGCMQDKSRCLTHDLWEELGEKIESYLTSLTLADVCAKQSKKVLMTNCEVMANA